jgi:uncharacterized membrane protein (UPF0127 family)
MDRYVRVANLTRGTSVADRCRVASSLRERTVGLLATPSLEAGGGLLIERTQSIHMFFMRYAIDVAFLDRHGRVTRTVSNLRPWRVVWWARGARDCLELPVGALAASRTVAGDQLEIDPAN